MLVLLFFQKPVPGPYVTTITTGKIVDMGIKDSNNMGAAMAPAALDTLITHFKDTAWAIPGMLSPC